MNDRIKNTLFFFIVFTLIFNNIPNPIQMNFIGGVIGSKLAFYPVILSFIYTAYCQYKYGNVLVKLSVIKKYILVYLFVVLFSLVYGLYNYPYFELITNGPINQIEKLPKVLAWFSGYGINLNSEIAISFWMVARVIKSLAFEIIYTFGGAYMIYCWYKDDWKNAFVALCKGVMCSLAIVFLYSVVEILYLAGNETAKCILEIINPYIHVVKVNHGWWPPLLWKGQIRSVFVEPSFFSIWIAFAMPFVWYKVQVSKTYKNRSFYCLCLMLFAFLVFMTKARTGVTLLLGEVFLLLLFTLYMRNVSTIKYFGIISICLIISFGLSTAFINIYMESKSKQTTVSSYVKDNVGSIASTTKRSNTARYSTIIANVKIGLDNPVFGVGKGLAPGYMPDYFPYMAAENKEVQNWIRYQNEKGILKMGIPSFSAYSLCFAETGLLGLILYMIPPLYLLSNVCKRVFYSKEMNQYLFMMISLLGMLASGFSNTLNITYCYWILLGLGYAMCFGKEGCIHDDK